MSNYKRIVSSQAINAAYTSGPQDLQQAQGVAIQCVFTGTTIAGTVAIETSVDLALTADPLNNASSANWNVETNSTLAATGNVIFNISAQFIPYFRVTWADTGCSSNARLTITTFVKG